MSKITVQQKKFEWCVILAEVLSQMLEIIFFNY